MSHTQVTLKFIVDTSKVQHFIESMTKAADDLEDAYRCPAVDQVQDMRCELPRDHDEDRHVSGTLSWPVHVAIGHVPCPLRCVSASKHHHWTGPNGVDWVFPGYEEDCRADHLEDWKNTRK